MSKHTFINKEIELLMQNNNIKRVTPKTITFKDEFKIDFVRNCIKVADMDEYLASLDLSLELIGKKRMEESFYRWNAIYNEQGPDGLVGQCRGRPVDLKSASFKKLSYK